MRSKFGWYLSVCLTLLAASALIAQSLPTVHIDIPSPGSNVSGTITIAGWAIDNSSNVGSAIAAVRAQVDGGTASNATYGASRPDVCAAYPSRPGCPNVGFSYSLDTSTLVPGSHTITISATDSDGTPDIGSSSATVTVVVQPTVHIDIPAPGSNVSGTITISGWAIDNSSNVGSAIAAVRVQVDGGAWVAATYGVSRADVCAAYPSRAGCPNVGFSYSLDTSALTPGSHTITVSATDSDGTPDTGSSSVTVTAVGVPPTVHIDSPATGSNVSGTITVAGWAIDNTSNVGSAITAVRVQVDSGAGVAATYGVSRPDVCAAYPSRAGCPNVGFSYSLNTATLTPGSHTITVSATDSDATADTGSSSVTVSVPGSPAPDFSLTMSPNPATVMAGGSVNYTVTVTGANGFGGTVNFTPSGLPSGATATFSPASVTGSGSTTLTIATSMSGATGSFTITAAGASASLSHAGTASLSIDPNDCFSGYWGDNRIIMVTPNDAYAYTETWSVDPGATYWTNYVRGTLKRGTTTINGPQDSTPTTGTAHTTVQFPDFDPTLPSGTFVMSGEHWHLSATCQQYFPAGGYGIHQFDTFMLSVPEVRSISPSPSYGIRGSTTTVDAYGVGLSGVDGVQVSGSGVTVGSRTVFDDTHVRISLNIAANAQSSTTPRDVTVMASNPNTVTDNSDPNNPKRTSITTPASANPFNFTIADPTPVINGVQQLGDLAPGGQAYISIYGNNFGSSQGTLGFCVQDADPCTGAGIDYVITYWSNIQVNALLTAQPAAQAGTYGVQLTATTGSTGLSFQPAPQAQTRPQSGLGHVLVKSLNVTLTPSTLNLSTGDTDKYITTSVYPSTVQFSVIYNAALASLQPPGSECNPTLTLPNGNGTNFVNSTLQASPSNCSGVFNVIAFANSKPSDNGTIVVIPPQALIWQMTSEARDYNLSTDPGNVAQQSVGVAGRNRFTQSGFSGVSTYNGLVNSEQVASGMRPSNGVMPQLDNASGVFTGTVGDVVGGAGCYWSPRSDEMPFIQAALDANSTTFPAGPTTDGKLRDPKCYLPDSSARQIVWRVSMPNNIRSDTNLYQGAPAFLFERPRNPTDPAVVQIP